MLKKFIGFLALWVLAFAVAMAAADQAAAGEDDTAQKEETEKAAKPATSQSPVAINNMAESYYRGKGVKQDYAKAFILYKKAADMGHVPSQIWVGFMYEKGEGVKQDYAQAKAWYEKAAAKGYASAQKALGDLYRNGLGVSQDYTTAAQWYVKAADTNDGGALCELGRLYLDGKGVEQDHKKAKAILEKGTAQNNACSYHYLSFMYRVGYASFLPDSGKAMELEREAANGGIAEAQYNIGLANERRWIELATERDAIVWYEHSAAGGYAPAMDRLAEVYEKGQLKQSANPELAKKWQQRASAAWKTWKGPRPEPGSRAFMPLKN